MTNILVEVELNDGAGAPFVSIDGNIVPLVRDGNKAEGTITVGSGVDGSSRHLMVTSWVGPVGAKCKVSLKTIVTTILTTSWLKINNNTTPYGGSMRRFSL